MCSCGQPGDGALHSKFDSFRERRILELEESISKTHALIERASFDRGGALMRRLKIKNLQRMEEVAGFRMAALFGGDQRRDIYAKFRIDCKEEIRKLKEGL